MINRSLSFILVLFITLSSAALAAGDPMKSLFLFQQKMAKGGSASAMMKMGEMYERGEGVEKSYDNALKMYEKANSAGHAKAKVAIQRLKNSKNKSANNALKAKLKEQQRQKAITAEKKRKQRQAAAARNKEKAERKAANDKALREKSNKAKAAKLAKAKAAKKAKAQADAAKLAKARAAKKARIEAQRKRKESKNPKEGFKSDPCKGKAARLLSICR